MGYYVNLIESDFIIPESNEVLQALREMPKKYHSIMRGGSSNGEKWFSWMNSTDIENAEKAQDIFEKLGFDCETDKYGDKGTFSLEGYNSKTGQEDLFLAVVAPFVAEDSYTEWRGEDGELWRYTVKSKKLTIQSASVAWNHPEEFKIQAFHSTGSFDDKTYRTHLLVIDPYADDIAAQVEAKKAKLAQNA